MSVSVVTRRTLREQVKQVLIDRILSGYYQPGDRLVEIRIADELGTSQSPVREALRDLELLRFVESEPYRGARVRAVTAHELTEVYPVRAALEEIAARAAAVRLAGDVGGLAAELEAMRRAASGDDLQLLVAHNVAFHRLIIEASGNQVLAEVWSSLRVELRTVVTCLAAGLDLERVAAEHEPLLEAVASGDPDRAGEAVRTHYERYADVVLRGGGQ